MQKRQKAFTPPPVQPRFLARGAGFTFVEVLVSMGIITIIFGAVLSFLIASDKSWRIGKDKLYEQQQARIAIDNITRSLQSSSPRWRDAATGLSYTVTLSPARIDFYLPVFYPDCCPRACVNISFCQDAQGLLHAPEDIQKLVKVTYKLNPDDPTQLLRKEGRAPSAIVAHQIGSLSFSCGCSGCSRVDDSCPFVDISLTIQGQTQHTVKSTVALRNKNITLNGTITVEEPREGEF